MKRIPAQRRRAGGFTLIEIVIVLVILAGIMAMVGPRVFSNLGRAKSQEAKIQMQQVAAQLEMFKVEVGLIGRFRSHHNEPNRGEVFGD